MSEIVIEIYELGTGRVTEKKTFKTERQVQSFEYYFWHQCNTEQYGFRKA